MEQEVNRGKAMVGPMGGTWGSNSSRLAGGHDGMQL